MRVSIESGGVNVERVLLAQVSRDIRERGGQICVFPLNEDAGGVFHDPHEGLIRASPLDATERVAREHGPDLDIAATRALEHVITSSAAVRIGTITQHDDHAAPRLSLHHRQTGIQGVVQTGRGPV